MIYSDKKYKQGKLSNTNFTFHLLLNKVERRVFKSITIIHKKCGLCSYSPKVKLNNRTFSRNYVLITIKNCTFNVKSLLN